MPLESPVWNRFGLHVAHDEIDRSIPETPAARLAIACGTCIPTMKAVTLLLCAESDIVFKTDLQRRFEETFGSSPMATVDRNTIFDYCQALVHHGALAEVYAEHQTGSRYHTGFAVTALGETLLPVAAFCIETEYSLNTSLAPFFGLSGIKNRKDKTYRGSAAARMNILTLLSKQDLSKSQLSHLTSRPKRLTRNDLVELARAGAITYESVGPYARMPSFLFTPIADKEEVEAHCHSPVDHQIIDAIYALPPPQLPFRMRDIAAAVLKDTGGADSNGQRVAKLRDSRIYKRTCQLVVLLERDGQMKRLAPADRSKEGFSHPKITDLGRNIVNEFVVPLQQLLATLTPHASLLSRVRTQLPEKAHAIAGLHYPHSMKNKLYPGNLEERIIAHFRSNDSAQTVSSVSRAIGLTQEAVRGHLVALHRKGLLDMTCETLYQRLIFRLKTT